MSHHDCGDPMHRTAYSRREFMRVGAIGGLGLTLGGYLQARGAAAAGLPDPKAKSVIYIFMQGGMSHMDSFDPKPLAPLEYRGELGTVKTNVEGVLFSGQFKDSAKVADKLAVIRSMTHGEAAHERGVHNMLTGYRPSPAVVYPSMGSVTAHEFGPRNNLPAYVCIPQASDPFQGAGYLSSAYGPFSVGGNPNGKNFQVRDLNMPKGVDGGRMDRRRTLLQEVDSHFRELESSDALSAMDSFYERAYSLISSQEAREAFNISAEPDEIRKEYGMTTMGQELLLARRLVEAGVRFVNVVDGGWDHHRDIRKSFERQAPSVDQAFATLVRDLERRGLLESTMVVLTTEFGRTSRINPDGGRDHWPKVFSTVLAGGGIRGGQVLGSSDAYGAEPSDRPVGPPDLAATVFHQLGIDPDKNLFTADKRPLAIARHFELIKELV